MKRAAFLQATSWMCLLQCFKKNLLMFVVFFSTKQKERKNRICTKRLKYFHKKKKKNVETGLSPEGLYKCFIFLVNVQWCQLVLKILWVKCTALTRRCVRAPALSVCIQHNPAASRHYIPHATLRIPVKSLKLFATGIPVGVLLLNYIVYLSWYLYTVHNASQNN